MTNLVLPAICGIFFTIAIVAAKLVISRLAIRTRTAVTKIPKSLICILLSGHIGLFISFIWALASHGLGALLIAGLYAFTWTFPLKLKAVEEPELFR